MIVGEAVCSNMAIVKSDAMPFVSGYCGVELAASHETDWILHNNVNVTEPVFAPVN
jgi:hypothetical protein